MILIVAELLGAIAGAFLLKFLVPAVVFDQGNGGIPALAPEIAIGKGILIEAVCTFFLVFAVFGTAVDERGPFAKTAGLTIGLVIAFDIMAFVPYTGAAMNPARWLGPALATTIGPTGTCGSWDRSRAASSPGSCTGRRS